MPATRTPASCWWRHPSGVTLAPEGGAHQSIGTPLIGMAQDGLAAFEPAFVDELAVIMRFAFDYMQRDGEGDPTSETWLRDETGGSVYLRLSTPPVEQPQREMTPDRERHHRRRLLAAPAGSPMPRSSSPIQGAVAPEAIAAVGLMAEDRRDVGAARRHLGRPAERRLDGGGAGAPARPRHATSHVERLLAVCRAIAASSPWSTAIRRRSPGSARPRPPGQGARRRAFRPDRHDRRSLPPPSASTLPASPPSGADRSGTSGATRFGPGSFPMKSNG
jgi:hypothetical protein